MQARNAALDDDGGDTLTKALFAPRTSTALPTDSFSPLQRTEAQERRAAALGALLQAEAEAREELSRLVDAMREEVEARAGDADMLREALLCAAEDMGAVRTRRGAAGRETALLQMRAWFVCVSTWCVAELVCH